MKFDDLIKYKALHLQYVASGAGADVLLDGLTPEQKKKHFRNVCAMIDLTLFERLEIACAGLAISKRLFIETALRDCLDRAEPSLDDVHELLAASHEASHQPDVLEVR